MKPPSGVGKTNPIYAIGIKPNFKGKQILLPFTINGPRQSFDYCADEIQAAKACDEAPEISRGLCGAELSRPNVCILNARLCFVAEKDCSY
ncbi:MAG TPA: hypothetical protein VMW16_05240 [Sedimentisphaerales bacterium]|nr:hypothetical protein [Sedimentisphaerales bacterium]